MHYPWWYVPFLTSPMLIAIISVLHVLVSHYAVGGGFFLAVETGFAYRTMNADYLEYLRRHAWFFILITVVYGAITGVGIWWTIGLASPLATETLIHNFVFGWAIEYVAFIVEIAAGIGPSAIVNSLTCDPETFRSALPALARAQAGAVIMLKDRAGIPETVERSLALAASATEAARAAGMAPSRVYLDPAIAPIAAGGRSLAVTLDAIRELARRYPDWGRIAGLSNVSFGLPERSLVNRACAAMLVASGVTALVCDTTDRELARALAASEALAGADPMCKRYLAAFRARRARG